MRGRYDSEEVFSHDGSCGATPTAASVCLQLWINRLEAREPVRWKETRIPAGRRTSEPGRVEVNEPGETRRPARFNLRPASMRLLFALRGETRTTAPASQGSQRSAPPEAAAQVVSGAVDVHPQKMVRKPSPSFSQELAVVSGRPCLTSSHCIKTLWFIITKLCPSFRSVITTLLIYSGSGKRSNI